MSDRLPNIFIFIPDQYQAAPVIKGHPCNTPAVERLAEEGVRFDRYYTPTPHCCPARASFFTGLYPSRHGVYNNVINETAVNETYKPDVRFFSENLRIAGYNLGLTGKWHVSSIEEPSDRGWDEIYPTCVKEVRHGLTWDEWLAAAQEVMSDAPRRRGELVLPGYERKWLYGTSSPNNGFESRKDYFVVTKAIEAMRRYAQEDKPWCVFCSPVGPHDPYVVPEKYANMYDPGSVELPPSFRDDLLDKPRLYQRQKKMLWSALSEQEHREAIAHYWGYCTMMDDYFAMVCDAIDELGLRENTILIFLSDHGDYVGAHGLYCKGVPAFDEAYRVPLIVRWPGGISKPGRVIDEFVTHCDIAPTLLEVAGLEQNPTSGRSLVPFFSSDEVDDWPQEFHGQINAMEYYFTQRLVQTKEFKYVFNPGDFDELYDLRNDPYEMKNVSDDPEYRDVKFDLVKRMWRFAAKENDIIGNKYFTAAVAPWGPTVGLKE